MIDSPVAEFDRRAAGSRPNSLVVELGALRAPTIGNAPSLSELWDIYLLKQDFAGALGAALSLNSSDNATNRKEHQPYAGVACTS
ncbi:MAG: hypothetical protein ACRDRI_22770 [Pseudonocardiaceae bacterium]